MKILFAVDQFYAANNGLTISARRYASKLREMGHEVRVAGTGEEGQPDYRLRKQYIPIFDRLVSSQGMTFAKPDDDLIAEAVAWADVIHIFSPFIMGRHVINEAKKQGKPYTGAFHVQPENITASIYLQSCEPVNKAIYAWFRFYIFKHCPYIHCPSEFIARQLRKHGYKSELHVISNGIDPNFSYIETERYRQGEVFTILSIGRYSREKRQDILLDAVAKSKYSDRIRVVLAGKGPRKKYLKKLADSIENEVIMEFCDRQKLLENIAKANLYVHCADMEIEGMSCMEAFACGLVPVISDSSKSATSQFALDDRSVFKAGNADDLAKKIDYWIEHSEELFLMGKKYADSAREYSLENSVAKAEKMLVKAYENR